MYVYILHKYMCARYVYSMIIMYGLIFPRVIILSNMVNKARLPDYDNSYKLNLH